MDPHKRSVTVEVMQADETIVGHGRFGTDVAGFDQLVIFAAHRSPSSAGTGAWVAARLASFHGRSRGYGIGLDAKGLTLM